MKKSLRAKRMGRNLARMKASPKLNLVSLMDIFTILVFFLMVNSGDVEVLQNNKAIALPESVAEKKPDNTLVVSVSRDDIVVQGRKVAETAAVLKSDNAVISGLMQELKYQRGKRTELTEREKEIGLAITIMGDQSVPYDLLKKVMTTCAKTDYRNISLAVSKVASAVSAGSAIQES